MPGKLAELLLLPFPPLSKSIWENCGWRMGGCDGPSAQTQNIEIAGTPDPAFARGSAISQSTDTSNCICQLNWICKTEMWPKTSGPKPKKCASHKWIFTGKALQWSASVVIRSIPPTTDFQQGSTTEVAEGEA